MTAMRFLIILLAFFAVALPATAQTFTEALSLAYHNSPQLAASQAELRAVDTTVAEAQSGWRPTVALGGDAGVGVTRFQGNSVNSHPYDATASIAQPIFRGGRTIAATGVAKNNVFAQRAVLLDTEQTVLLNAAASYLDVIRDMAVLELNRNNQSVLQSQLKASNNRFQVGEITKTDVSQSQSRLSGADAGVIQSEGQLNVSRAMFTRLVGQAPATLTAPDFELQLPASLDETITRADKQNPGVIAANYADMAAQKNIDLVRGNLLPEVDVVGSGTRSWDGSASGNNGIGATTVTNGHIDDARIVGSVTIPLYQAGADYARLSGARETATQRRLELDNARRNAREAAVTAWTDLEAARATLQAREAQIKAADLAAGGVRQENTVGTRTVLDVLDAEQELLNAQVARQQAERDVKVAALQLLAATGQLTAQNLKLAGPYYNPVEHYDALDGSWFGG